MGYILLIEDNKQLARTFGRVLKGSKLVWTPTAEQALSQLEADANVAVLLCDLHLHPSGMQGKEMVDLVRRQWPELFARTYVLSGHDFEDVQSRFEYPIERYIRKPVGIKDLRAAVSAFSPDRA